ncbi:MAG: ribose-5-phosphate isomerase RpiA, partial [Caulobacterales bacterium]|nr:ribose-5-phosphate isomerase RpiA [Caulobacterales bacterium]
MATQNAEAALRAKENAARAALGFIEDGMVLGLGSGTTAELFIECLGARIAEEDLIVRGVPTSDATARAAEAAGVPLGDIDQVQRIHLAVDGADEVDPMFNLVKGGGGRLLREKIVAEAADQFVVIVDESKVVDRLGAFPLPVEVDRFGFTVTARRVFEALRAGGAKSAEVNLRRVGREEVFLTNHGRHPTKTRIALGCDDEG